ncbi:MAG: PilZ domain-containing protein [Gammaproteobacteria bacterium]|nr:PilZ domain-containing protein [Gammaproteobacteria bacterium]
MMTVDTRYQSRTNIRIPVEIIHRGRCVHARTRNLSIGGMFIETSALKIPSGTLIGLEFSLNDTQWQIDGLVVRQDGDGLGTIFRMPQPELFKSAADHVKAQATRGFQSVKATQLTQLHPSAAHSNSDY